jgi:hypothetical protein
MDEILWLLEQAMRDLQAARRRAGSKRVRAHLRLAIARINQVHHILTTYPLRCDVARRRRIALHSQALQHFRTLSRRGSRCRNTVRRGAGERRRVPDG